MGLESFKPKSTRLGGLDYGDPTARAAGRVCAGWLKTYGEPQGIRHTKEIKALSPEQARKHHSVTARKADTKSLLFIRYGWEFRFRGARTTRIWTGDGKAKGIPYARNRESGLLPSYWAGKRLEGVRVTNGQYETTGKWDQPR